MAGLIRGFGLAFLRFITAGSYSEKIVAAVPCEKQLRRYCRGRQYPYHCFTLCL